MKFYVIIILAVCAIVPVVVSSRRSKCCSLAPSCAYDSKMNIINIKQCPAAPCCKGENAELIQEGDNCCCDYEMAYDGPRSRPFLGIQTENYPEPKELPMCVSDNDSIITGGFLDVCPSSSICPSNTAIVLEMSEDVTKAGKCCCASPNIASGLKFA